MLSCKLETAAHFPVCAGSRGTLIGQVRVAHSAAAARVHRRRADKRARGHGGPEADAVASAVCTTPERRGHPMGREGPESAGARPGRGGPGPPRGPPGVVAATAARVAARGRRGR